jgi:bifunctional ADP-heptose synthase (sugar kinase/adenylyltransferase)
LIELKDIQLLKPFKVLLIGDSCVDKYHYGKCERISPEAPVPIFEHLYTKEYPGMASNVYKNLQNLGLNCDFKSNDHLIVKERFVDHKTRQQFLRVDTGEISNPRSAKIEDFGDLDQYGVLIISDYDKGYITYDFAKELTDKFKGLIFVDSKKKNLSCFENSLIKINEYENRDVFKFPVHYELVVTMGKDGAQWNGINYPIEDVEVFDVCGAGDSFFSGLIISYLICLDIDESIIFANHCARASVQKRGTYAVNLTDIF